MPQPPVIIFEIGYIRLIVFAFLFELYPSQLFLGHPLILEVFLLDQQFLYLSLLRNDS